MKRIQWALLTALAFLACNQQPTFPASERTLRQFSVEVPGVEFPARTALQLRAWGLYSDGSKIDLTAQSEWSSVDPAVGRVGASGIAQLDGVGLARFEVRFEDRLVPVNIHVTGAVLESLTLSTPDTGGLAAGDTRRFTARARFNDGTSLDVTDRTTWVADGVALDTTGTPGVVVGRKEGPGLLRATYYSQQSSVMLAVAAPRFAGLSLDAPKVTVRPGDTHRLVVYATFSDGTRRDVSAQSAWTSSDSAIVDLSMDGVLRGVIFARAAGSARLTATWNDALVSVELRVEGRQVVGLGFDTLGLQVAQGRSASLDLLAEFDDGTRGVVSASASWTSSQTAVADVSNVDGFRGAVNTHAMGVATIHAWYAGLEASYEIRVTAPELMAVGATLAGGRLAVGQTADFIVGGTFSDGTTLNISSVVAIGHGPGLLTSVADDRVQVTGTGLGTVELSLELNGIAHELSLEVSDATITSLEIRDVPQRVPNTLGPAYQGPLRFRALATYSDGAQLDVTELSRWWLDDATLATMSDLPGTRGAYALDLGGVTGVRVAIAGQIALLTWNFPVNP